MKKVLFWLGFALAIFLPAAIQAKELNPAPFFKICQQGYTVHEYQAVCDNILICDLLEDESDDSVTESGRKKTTSGKSQFHTTSFFAESFPDTNFKSVLPTGYLVIHVASLNIFLGVFRL